MLWVTKETRTKVHLLSTFLVTARNWDMVRVEKCSNGFVYLKRWSKRLIGDKFNPAYMSEVKGTTGKGEDDKVQFTIELLYSYRL
jgi:hypothetical protein